MRASAFLAPLLAAMAAAPATSQPDSSVELGPFNAVEVNGGHVTVRHGSARNLVVREGSLEISRVAMVGDRLVIERCPRHDCPRGYRLDIDLTTPELSSLAVENGGRLQTSGAFPTQPTVAAAVSNGGMLDIRSLSVARVTAAVAHGGRILTRPGEDLTASVSHGGVVTYWGNARVRSSINHGGAVTAGDEADAERALAEMNPRPIAPLPALAVPRVPATPGKPMPSTN